MKQLSFKRYILPLEAESDPSLVKHLNMKHVHMPDGSYQMKSLIVGLLLPKIELRL